MKINEMQVGLKKNNPLAKTLNISKKSSDVIK
jgi:hypothetical protein